MSHHHRTGSSSSLSCGVLHAGTNSRGRPPRRRSNSQSSQASVSSHDTVSSLIQQQDDFKQKEKDTEEKVDELRKAWQEIVEEKRGLVEKVGALKKQIFQQQIKALDHEIASDEAEAENLTEQIQQLKKRLKEREANMSKLQDLREVIVKDKKKSEKDRRATLSVLEAAEHLMPSHFSDDYKDDELLTMHQLVADLTEELNNIQPPPLHETTDATESADADATAERNKAADVEHLGEDISTKSTEPTESTPMEGEHSQNLATEPTAANGVAQYPPPPITRRSIPKQRPLPPPPAQLNTGRNKQPPPPPPPVQLNAGRNNQKRPAPLERSPDAKRPTTTTRVFRPAPENTTTPSIQPADSLTYSPDADADVASPRGESFLASAGKVDEDDYGFVMQDDDEEEDSVEEPAEGIPDGSTIPDGYAILRSKLICNPHGITDFKEKKEPHGRGYYCEALGCTKKRRTNHTPFCQDHGGPMPQRPECSTPGCTTGGRNDFNGAKYCKKCFNLLSSANRQEQQAQQQQEQHTNGGQQQQQQQHTNGGGGQPYALGPPQRIGFGVSQLYAQPPSGGLGGRLQQYAQQRNTLMGQQTTNIVQEITQGGQDKGEEGDGSAWYQPFLEGSRSRQQQRGSGRGGEQQDNTGMV